MVSEITEFKGNPIISLKRDEEDKYGLTFGIRKAKLVIEHIEDIKKFIAENE